MLSLHVSLVASWLDCDSSNNRRMLRPDCIGERSGKGLVRLTLSNSCTFVLTLLYSSNPVVISQNESEIDRLQTLSIIHWLNRTEQCIIFDPLPKNWEHPKGGNCWAQMGFPMNNHNLDHSFNADLRQLELPNLFFGGFRWYLGPLPTNLGTLQRWK